MIKFLLLLIRWHNNEFLSLKQKQKITLSVTFAESYLQWRVSQTFHYSLGSGARVLLVLGRRGSGRGVEEGWLCMVWRSPLVQRRVRLAFVRNVAEAILIGRPFSRQPRGVLLALRTKRRKKKKKKRQQRHSLWQFEGYFEQPNALYSL